MSETAYDYPQAKAQRPGNGQITEQLDRQGSQLDALQATITELEARLNPICIAKPETGGMSEPSGPTPVLAPIAERVSLHTASIVGATKRLQELVSALEI